MRVYQQLYDGIISLMLISVPRWRYFCCASSYAKFKERWGGLTPMNKHLCATSISCCSSCLWIQLSSSVLVHVIRLCFLLGTVIRMVTCQGYIAAQLLSNENLKHFSVIFKYSLVLPRLTLMFCLNAFLCSHLREWSTRKKTLKKSCCLFFSAKFFSELRFREER